MQYYGYMFELFRKNQPVEDASVAQRKDLEARIGDISSRIENGTHMTDDAKILANLKQELENLK